MQKSGQNERRLALDFRSLRSKTINDAFTRTRGVFRAHYWELGSAVSSAIALGEPTPIGGKVDFWRDIDRVGAGVVVEGEVEAIAARSRGPPALRSAEREAIGLEAGNRVIALACLPRGQSSIAAGRSALARGRRDCREPRMIGLVPRKRGPGPRPRLAASPLGGAEANARAGAAKYSVIY